MSGQFTPARLVSARQRRGLTLTALGKQAEISIKSLSEFENGKKVPSPKTQERLATALRVPLEYLVQMPLEEIPETAVSFRARTKMTQRQRHTSLAAASHAVALHEWIAERYELPASDVPTLHRFTAAGEASSPALAAEVVRARWGLGIASLGNIVHLLEMHGVAVFSLRGYAAEVDAFSFRHRKQPFIMLNTDKSGERGRFDAAHELGHLVLHSEDECPTGREAEQEANAFASAFLMPEPDVRAHLGPNPDLGTILQKKRRWGVAAMALSYRLHDLGLLSDWLYQKTCVNLSRHGYRTTEKFGIDRESSRLLGMVFADLRAKPDGLRSLHQDLAVAAEDIHDLVFGLATVALSGHGQKTTETRPNLSVIHGGSN